MPKEAKFYEPGKVSGIKAEYDMWVREYDRLDAVLQAITDDFILIRAQPERIMRLYDLLNEFWAILRPITEPVIREKKERDLKKLKETVVAEMQRLARARQYSGTFAIKEAVIEELDEFRNTLMDIRQMKGMGVKGYKEKSNRQLLKSAAKRGD